MTLTPEMIAWIASFAGALLFFIAGFLLANLRGVSATGQGATRRGPVVGETRDPSPGENFNDSSPQEIQASDAILRELEEYKKLHEQQKEENKSIFAAAKSRIVKMKRQVETTNAAVTELKAKLSAAHRKLAEAESEKTTLSGELQRVREELASRSDGAAASAREEELHRELALKTEKFDEQVRYLEKLEETNRELASQAKILEDEMKRLADLESTNQELSIKSERLQDRIREMESLKEENRTLKSNLVELEASHNEIARLKKENAKLNSMGIVIQEPPKPSTVLASPDGFGGACQNVVNQLSKPKTSRGVVLADELGLLIAGTGDHTESMAAMAAIFSTMSERVGSILPFSEIDQITIANMDKLTLTMQPYEIASDKLIVTALSVGPGPTREEVTELIKQNAAA